MSIRRRSKTVVWLVAAIVVVAVAIVVAVVLAAQLFRTPSLATITTTNPGMTMTTNTGSTSDFDAAVAAYTQASQDMNAEMAVAQQLSDSSWHVADNNSYDNSSMNNLNTAINDVSDAFDVPVVVDPPVMADAPEDVKAQIAQLQSDSQTMNAATASLTSAVQAVHEQQIAWARNVLTVAISLGQDRLSTWDDDTDQRVANLQSAMDAAQAIIDGLGTADPTSVWSDAWDASLIITSTIQQFDTSSWGEAPGGVLLTGDIDGRVSIPTMPKSAIKITPNRDGLQIFQMPSGNIGCTGSADGVMCEIVKHTWDIPPVLKTICDMETLDGYCGAAIMSLGPSGYIYLYPPTGEPPWSVTKSYKEPITTLKYGQIVNWDPFACLSASDGVTCWDTHSFHGFKINTSTVKYW